MSSRCGAFPPVDGFCVGGHAVQEAGDELGVGAPAAGEAELPQFCGGTVVVVDRLIHRIGVDLASAVAVYHCPDVAEQSGELRLVVGAYPFLRGAPFGFRGHDATVPRCSQTGRGPGLTSRTVRDVGRQCRGGLPALRSNPARRHDPRSGVLTLGSRPPWVAAQPGGRDEQISWATAERTAPDVACVAAVGYSVIAWIDGKEKVGGSIRQGARHRAWTCELTRLALFHIQVVAVITKEEKVGPAAVARALTCCNVGAALAAIATASAEQISACRADKFGHGMREDRLLAPPHGCSAGCAARSSAGARGTSQVSCAFGPGGPVRLPLRSAQPVSARGPSASPPRAARAELWLHRR